MAAAKRKPDPALIERLLREPEAFEFFRAVELLERHLASKRRGSPRPVGFDHPHSEVGVRFGAAASLGFPSTPLSEVRRSGARDPYEVSVSFLGLIGPAGTLPAHYTETVLNRVHAKDRSLRDFLDAMQDRTAALFYRAWKKYRLPAAYGSSDRERGDADPVLNSILSLVGLNPRPRGKPISLEHLAQAHHAGHFSDRRRSAHGLRAILRGLLRCEIQVEQFVGRWIALDPEAQSRLGGKEGPGAPARLGVESVLGARVWSVDSGVRIVAGPLDRETFRRLWPGGEPVRFVRAVVRAYLGPLIEYDLIWDLAPDAPAALELGGDARLGRDCWLGWSERGGPDLRVSSPAWNDAGSSPDARTLSSTIRSEPSNVPVTGDVR